MLGQNGQTANYHSVLKHRPLHTHQHISLPVDTQLSPHYWRQYKTRAQWHSGNALVSINEVAQRSARLVIRRVTALGQVNHTTQANSAWPSLRGRALWVLAMAAAIATEENGKFCAEYRPFDQDWWYRPGWIESAIRPIWVITWFNPRRFKASKGMNSDARDLSCICKSFFLRRRLQLRFDLDSTAIRRPCDSHTRVQFRPCYDHSTTHVTTGLLHCAVGK